MASKYNIFVEATTEGGKKGYQEIIVEFKVKPNYGPYFENDLEDITVTVHEDD